MSLTLTLSDPGYFRQLTIRGGGMQARVQGGGPKGPGPPLEIEKPKKKKKVIRANIKLFHLYFATFLVENVIFSASF